MAKNTKKYLTIEDLLSFCKQSNLSNFSAKDAGGPIIVQSFGTIETSDNTTVGLTPCVLKACHTELNLNKSFISDDVMNSALASFSNRPILAYIHQLEDGTYHFWDHRMEIVEDGDDVRVEYLERPIGVVPESCNAHLEYDKKRNKNYVVVNGYIYDDYGNQAIDIIKDNNGQVDVSVELAIHSLSYNAKENYLNIEDFTFMGVTCLGETPDGKTVNPGMEGSNLKLDSFSVEQNSMFTENYQEELLKTLKRLNQTLEIFNTNTTQKGGDNMGKLEELLAKYNVTADDVTFEIEGLSDEELETKFAEAFEGDDNSADEGEGDSGSEGDDTDDDNSGDGDGENDDEGEDADDGEPATFTKTFAVELSHEDVRYALYNLISQYDEEDNDWYVVRSVYDSYFYMQGWVNNKLYKLGYTVDGENVSLEGERQEMFEIIVSESEKLAIDKMREDYAALEGKYNELKEFKDTYDAAELKAKKDAIFAREEYSILIDDEAFKTLQNDAANFSVEEVEAKAKAIFADYVIKTGEFSANKEENKPKTLGFNFNKKESKKGPYGNLFAKD